MGRYLYGALHKTKKFYMAYTDNNKLVLSYNDESFQSLSELGGSYEFDEKDLPYLKQFIDKAYDKYKEERRK